MTGRLQGKVALITGAGRGQGRSHAIYFAEEGADLVLVDVCDDVEGVGYPLASAENLEETARRCRDLDRCVVTVRADVRSAEQVEAAVATGIAELGQIDVLVNNAGIATPSGTAWELSEEQWLLMIDTNLSGVWRCAKAVIPHMIERGSGCILSTRSARRLPYPPPDAGADRAARRLSRVRVAGVRRRRPCHRHRGAGRRRFLHQ